MFLSQPFFVCFPDGFLHRVWVRLDITLLPKCSAFGDSFFDAFWDGIFSDLGIKNWAKSGTPGVTFSLFFRRGPARGILEGPMPHFGILLAPCSSLWVAFSVRFRQFSALLRFSFASDFGIRIPPLRLGALGKLSTRFRSSRSPRVVSFPSSPHPAPSNLFSGFCFQLLVEF